MEIFTIDTGFFKLDGGAMFGVIPKTIWSRTNPSDEKNLCTWAMRLLLIKEGEHLILIDNGLGDKQDEKFFSFLQPHGEDSLEGSLKKYGFDRNDITDNFLTHLHFDHCGGGVRYSDDGSKFEMTFPNASYWTNSHHWNYALRANPREKSSFLSENMLPMQEAGKLKFLDPGEASPWPFFERIYVDGHTGQQMLPLISYKGRKILYCADLIPSSTHVPVHYVIGYDVLPLTTMKEKEEILSRACDENWVLFFEHDPKVECATVKRTEKGFKVDETFALSELG